MDPALWAALGGTGALLLVVAVATATAMTRRRGIHPREQAALAAARADVEALRVRVEELSAELAAARGAAAVTSTPTEYVITTAGSGVEGGEVPVLPERAVLSVTFGEPLVKLAALGYGLRRALSPESRNRIAFAMRREVKRARKARRRTVRRTRLSSAASEETAA
jgi:hypothetical protein